MNHSHGNDDKAVRIAAGVKAAMVICVLGTIVLIADRAFVTPSEHSGPGMTALRMPSVAAPLSPDGRFDANAPLPLFAGSTGRDRTAVASEARLYPELAGDAVRDEDGHPPSF
jgi:hypothetical protein